MNGVNAHSSVNVDTARSTGLMILKFMTVDGFTLKKNDQVISLSTESSIRIEGELVQIDPQLSV